MKRIWSTMLVLVLALAMCLGSFSVATAEGYDPLTIRLMTVSHATMPISEDMLTIKKIEELFNVKFEFELVVEKDYNEKLNALLTDPSTLPDVFYAPVSTMAQYYDFGVVRELDDLLAQYAPNMLATWESHGLTRNVKSDNGHFYYTTAVDESSMMECCGWMNADMMAECGIEAVPTTYEELYEDLKIFQDHYGIDSDYIPMSQGPWYTVQKPIYLAYHTYNSWVYFNDEEGYGYGPYTYADNMKAALSYMHKLYAEKLLDNEFLTRSADSINALCAEGKIGYMNTWADHAAAVAQGGTYGCNYIPVPALQADNGAEKCVGNKGAVSAQMYISAAASDEVAQRWLEIVNYIYSDEGILLFDYGIEGDTYEMVDGKPQLTDKVMKSELGALNGRRSFGMEPQCFPRLASWDGWSKVLWDCTVDVVDANAPYVWAQQPSLTGTFEEDSEISAIMADINTLVSTSLSQFIVGDKDIDTEWDAFVAQMKSMDIERAIEINNAKFQRWQER